MSRMKDRYTEYYEMGYNDYYAGAVSGVPDDVKVAYDAGKNAAEREDEENIERLAEEYDARIAMGY